MLVNVIVGGETKFLDNGVPHVIGGRLAVMDTSQLELREVTFETDTEITKATEYWEGDELRHRSVEMILKEGFKFEATFSDMK